MQGECKNRSCYSSLDKLVVQKSRPLLELSRSELNLPEFKLLDCYLAKIDSRNPQKKKVILSKGEIEQALGVDRIRTEDLTERLLNLGRGIKIPDPEKKNGFKIMWLLEEAQCQQDEDGKWIVTLEASSKAMDYFFNIEDIGYLRYKLRCVAELSSRYSYILFLYLEDNRFRKTWSVKVEELKQILNCDKEETYKEFKFFRRSVLEKSCKEINNKTECKCSYNLIKRGRRVSAIQFTVEPLLNAAIIEETSVFPDPEEENIRLYRDACGGEYNDDQIRELMSVVELVPEYKLPRPSADPDNLSLRRYHYLKQQYSHMKAVASSSITSIRQPYLYLVGIIKRDGESESDAF